MSAVIVVLLSGRTSHAQSLLTPEEMNLATLSETVACGMAVTVLQNKLFGYGDCVPTTLSYSGQADAASWSVSLSGQYDGKVLSLSYSGTLSGLVESFSGQYALLGPPNAASGSAAFSFGGDILLLETSGTNYIGHAWGEHIIKDFSGVPGKTIRDEGLEVITYVGAPFEKWEQRSRWTSAGDHRITKKRLVPRTPRCRIVLQETWESGTPMLVSGTVSVR